MSFTPLAQRLAEYGCGLRFEDLPVPTGKDPFTPSTVCGSVCGYHAPRWVLTCTIGAISPCHVDMASSGKRPQRDSNPCRRRERAVS